MAQSMFSYRGGARSRGVAGQPTGYGGAPMGSPGQTAMQAFRSAAIGGGQSITSAPSAPPQPTRTPSPTPGSTPLPAAPSLTPGSTTPMFKPAFALPNTSMARYVGSLAAQAPAPMQRQAPIAAQPTTVQRAVPMQPQAPVAAQPTAVQRAVQATPIGFGMTEAQRRGVGGPQVASAKAPVQPLIWFGKAYEPGVDGGLGPPLPEGTKVVDGNGRTGTVQADGAVEWADGQRTLEPDSGPSPEEASASAWHQEYLKWREKHPEFTGQFSDWYNSPNRKISDETAKKILAEQGTVTPPVPTIRTDDNGNVVVNGVPITDPNAEGADERSQAQRMLDDAEAVSRQEYEQATQQIDANQILQALAKAGEQGMRGGMSGFGLGEQGIVQQNALKGQLMASSNLASALSSLAAQQQSLDRDEYERLKEAYDMNSEEGRAGFARARRQSEIAQEIQKLQEGGVTPNEQAQIATLGAEYAELDAANKAAQAKQIGLEKPNDTLNEDGSLNTDKYGGDIESGVNASADPRVADGLRRKTVDDIKRYFANTRSQYGQNLGDYESVAVTRFLINDLIGRASEGDPVSSAILADLGLGHLIHGGFQGSELDDEIDRAMDRAWDEMMSRGDEATYATTRIGAPSLDWYFKRAGGPPPTGQLD